MNYVLMWVLVSIGGYNGNTVSYSPPVSDLETCQFIAEQIDSMAYVRKMKCVQIKVLK